MFSIFSKKNHRHASLLSQSVCVEESSCLYSKNVVVYSCVNLVASSVSGINIKAPNDRPNQQQSWSEFLEQLVIALLTASQVCIGKDADGLHVVKAAAVHQVDNNLYIGQQKIEGRLIRSTGNIMQVIKQAAKLYDLVTRYNISWMQKGGRLSGIVIPPHGVKQDDIDSLRKQIQTSTAGADNAGEILVLSPNCTWQELGAKQIDTSFLEGQLFASRQIAQAFKVPPILIGIQGDATFANYKEARLHFWEDTIIPLAKKIASVLQTLVADFEFDFTTIEALEVKINAYRQTIDSLSFLDRDEKRTLCNFI